jgi:hypothetical protein
VDTQPVPVRQSQPPPIRRRSPPAVVCPTAENGGPVTPSPATRLSRTPRVTTKINNSGLVRTSLIRVGSVRPCTHTAVLATLARGRTPVTQRWHAWAALSARIADSERLRRVPTALAPARRSAGSVRAAFHTRLTSLCAGRMLAVRDSAACRSGESDTRPGRASGRPSAAWVSPPGCPAAAA